MRWLILNLAVVVVVTAVWLRLAYWQVIAADSLRTQAASQRLTVVEVAGSRGEILASDGFPLAANRANYLLFANPKVINWNQKWLELARLLPASDSAQLSDRLALRQLVWVALSDQISPATRELIAKLNLEGIGFEPRPTRWYPEGSASAAILGFVGRDLAGQPQGYFGLEGYYDRRLAGKPGKVIWEQDALGHPIVLAGTNTFPAVDGQAVQTSLDRTLQFILSTKLVSGLERYGAVAGTITVMEPDTGQILAMVSLPGYDPGSYQQFDPSLFKNPVVADSYEPGSTFKVVTMAAALDAGVVKPDTKCEICTGPVRVAEYLIRTWNDQYYPDSTMTQVLVHSDNVGMVGVAKRLGRSQMLDYLRKFGIGQVTGIDLQDENVPLLRPDTAWSEVDLATTAFGQGIAITPLQMLRAVSAIANGGELPVPRLAAEPEKAQRVVSPATAAQVTAMMVKAVEDGEAKWAKPRGYTVAGKTGTAQIPVAGHYDQEKTIASFVGFAPAYHPRFAMLVTLREPQTSPWGSETAAPLWFEVASELFRYFKIGPDKPS